MKTKKSIRRPRNIKIADSSYKTVTRDKAWNKRQSAYGRIHFDKKMIEIGHHINKEELVDTYLHEICHSIFHEYDINISTTMEENIVTKLANGLTDFIKNNNKAIHWILKKIEEENQNNAS